MILLKTLIILLLLLIVAHLIKIGWGKKEGFEDLSQLQTDSNTKLATPLQPSTTVLSASQKAQAKAFYDDEDDNTINDHKHISKESFEMNKLKTQVEELLKLSDDAKKINESIISNH
jgi:hypothetical protein